MPHSPFQQPMRWKCTLSILDCIYRLLLYAYPATFRRTYGSRMVQTFRDSCRATLQRQGLPGLLPLWLSLFRDLALNSVLERYPTPQQAFVQLFPSTSALVAGLLVGYGDLHAKEVQGTVLIIFMLTFLFGLLLPRHVCRWILLIGLGVPLISWLGLIAGYASSPSGLPLHLDTLLALIPACIGTLCGALSRRIMRYIWRLAL